MLGGGPPPSAQERTYLVAYLPEKDRAYPNGSCALNYDVQLHSVDALPLLEEQPRLLGYPVSGAADRSFLRIDYEVLATRNAVRHFEVCATAKACCAKMASICQHDAFGILGPDLSYPHYHRPRRIEPDHSSAVTRDGPIEGHTAAGEYGVQRLKMVGIEDEWRRGRSRAGNATRCDDNRQAPVIQHRPCLS